MRALVLPVTLAASLCANAALAQDGGRGDADGPGGGGGGIDRPPLEASLGGLPQAVLDLPARNYSAIPWVRKAGDATEWCYKSHLTAGNLGDVSNTRLLQLQICIGNAMAELVDKMVALNSLQHAARFDFALFSETARLLTVSKEPAREAIDPFIAMLQAAEAAARNDSQRLLLQELNAYGETVRSSLAAT